MSYDNARQPTPQAKDGRRGALLIGAVVNALMAVVLLLLAWLYDCLQLVHVLLGLLSGGTSVLMARASTTGDPGGDTGTGGSTSPIHDDNPDSGGGGG